MCAGSLPKDQKDEMMTETTYSAAAMTVTKRLPGKVFDLYLVYQVHPCCIHCFDCVSEYRGLPMMDCFAISVTNLLLGMGMQRKMWKDVSEKAELYNI